MTNEQLTQSVVSLLEFKAKTEEELGMFKNMLLTMRDDIKATKSLTEDVHIMAVNMQNMQKSQDEINKKLEETDKKVDVLSSKEFIEYKENKKIAKQNLISKGISALTGALITGGVWLLSMYFKG